jgi:hypothetical protein
MAAMQGRIASVVGADSATVLALFAAVVADWRASGERVGGVLAEPHDLRDRTCAAGVLRNIVSGRTFRMYLETPPSGTSCHLDASGVQAACADILGQVATCDLIVLSKFGKLEAARSGLFEAFQAAMAADKPLLTSVSDRHHKAWRTFAPTALDLPAEATVLRDWWRDQRAPRGSTSSSVPSWVAR